MRRRGFRMLVPVAIAAACGLLLLSLSTAGSGATWTTTTTASGASTGTAQWCAAPDPSEVGARFIRLNSITTSVGTNQQMAIIPVANNTAWGGGGTGSKTLGIRLWGCQTAPVGNLRVTAWSNPTGTITDTWLTGSTVAPASRLSPASGLGALLKTSAQLASETAGLAVITGTPSGDLRRYSWLVANGRTASAPTANPAACATYLIGALGYSCSVTETNSTGGDATFAQLFNVTPWSNSTITATTYTANTMALQTTTGWGATNAWLNSSCVALTLVCTISTTPTTLAATSATDASLLASTNGNQLQWLVIQWTGTTTPPSDLVLEVFLQ